MSTANTRPLDKLPSSLATTPFTTRKFDFSGIEGLSNHSLEVHQSLYEGYVKETNALLPLIYATPSAAELSPLDRIKFDGLVRRFSFERNGMVLHELFFEALRGRSDPPRETGIFIEAVEQCFGSYQAWQNDIRKLARTRGIGWVITTQTENDDRLSNIWIDEHSHGLLVDGRVVLAIDLWEHAYIIDFKPADRFRYLQTIFDNIDWEVVESRCL